MIKDVWISIHSIQGYEQEDEAQLEFSTEGYYYYEDGVGCLSYQESEVTGLEGTRTSMIVMADQVVVDRDGMLTSRMVFRLCGPFSIRSPTITRISSWENPA